MNDLLYLAIPILLSQIVGYLFYMIRVKKNKDKELEIKLAVLENELINLRDDIKHISKLLHRIDRK